MAETRRYTRGQLEAKGVRVEVEQDVRNPVWSLYIKGGWVGEYDDETSTDVEVEYCFEAVQAENGLIEIYDNKFAGEAEILEVNYLAPRDSEYEVGTYFDPGEVELWMYLDVEVGQIVPDEEERS